jgi:multidrug resistance efflux pump
LSGEGLFTARAPDDLDVLAVAHGETVEQGAPLAVFGSPESEAEVAAMELRRATLEAEKEVLAHQALAVDSGIAQKLSEASAEARGLRANLNDLVLEEDRVLREALRERSAKQDGIKALQLELSRLEGELEQARSSLRYCREEHARRQKLHERGAIADEELALKTSELQSCEIEVRKLDQQLERAAEQRGQLDEALKAFLALSERQEKELASDIEITKSRLKEVAAKRAELQQRQAEDLARAARHREESLNKVGLELRRAAKELEAERAKLEVVAPRSGRIVFRSPSPGNVRPGDPVVVLAPAEGLCLTVRVPRWMKSSLEAADDVTCELLQDLERDVQRRFVESRFPTKLAGWRELPADPRFGVAELSCDCPAEAVHRLALGEQIAARIIWRPPLYAVPSFVLSALLAGAAALVWGVTHRMAEPTPVERLSVDTPRSLPSDSLRETSTEFGAEGVMLRILGGQLREMIMRRKLDAHVIAAAEWALDRHRARATRLLSLGLGDGQELCDQLESCVKELDAHGRLTGGNGSAGMAPMLDRLLAVLRAVAPAGSRERVARILEHSSKASPPGVNGRRHAELADCEPY